MVMKDLLRGTISGGFWLGQYLVTQDQWQEVMKNNPSKHPTLPKLSGRKCKKG